jgi:catechol 2,3-dioxygenase-like lactoylglutathione lyase family enzyme
MAIIEGMNHFNVLTDDVDKTRAFYVGILGLTEGERPRFTFDGAWLYAGGRPILHISKAKLPAERSTTSPSARRASREPSRA